MLQEDCRLQERTFLCSRSQQDTVTVFILVRIHWDFVRNNTYFNAINGACPMDL